MEKLQRIDVVGYPLNGTIERKRVVDNALQAFGIHILAEEGVGHLVRQFLERHLVDVVEELVGQLPDLLGHIETAVLGQSLHYRLLERSHRCLFIGAVVYHILDVHKSLHKFVEA